MRTAVFFVTLAVIAWCGLCSPVDRPHDALKPYEPRPHARGSSHGQDVKGRKTIPHHHNSQAPAMPRPELNLRKGEYTCRGRVCRLRPGEVPAGCNGVCQYPV